MKVSRLPQLRSDESSVRTDFLTGGDGCGHLWALVLWNGGPDPVAQPLGRPLVGDLHHLGLWLGLGY
jgi:hypothetical protein